MVSSFYVSYRDPMADVNSSISDKTLMMVWSTVPSGLAEPTEYGASSP